MEMFIKDGKPAFPSPTDDLKAFASDYSFAWLLSRLGRDSQDAGEPQTITYERAKQALSSEMTSRVIALAKHYRISTESPNLLASLFIAVANDFIPNFDVYRQKAKKGRPRKRHEKFGLSFLLAVEAKAQERGKGVSDACHQLAKKSDTWHGIKPTTLETRYYELKKSFAAAASESDVPPRFWGDVLGGKGLLNS